MATGKAAYNVPETQLGRIQCTACFAGLDLGGTLPIAMTDLAVRVAFPQDGAPELPLGQELELSFTIDDRKPLARRGRVQSRIDSGNDRVYSFSLLQTDTLRQEMGNALISAFNLRGAFRVRPDASAPIEATIALPDRTFSQPLKVEDISATGVAGRTDVDAEEVLSSVRDVLLRLTLEPGGEPIQLDAKIVGRDLASPCVTYRFAFAEDSARQERDVDKVMEYIMDRQRHLAATTIR